MFLTRSIITHVRHQTLSLFKDLASSVSVCIEHIQCQYESSTFCIKESPLLVGSKAFCVNSARSSVQYGPSIFKVD